MLFVDRQRLGMPLTTGAAANVTSISLTAGDWDVWINAHFSGGGTNDR